MDAYGMAPAHPPLPTAWNFPFQPSAGIQISTLMSESLVGVSVAVMRQNSGNFSNCANDPEPTTADESIFASGNTKSVKTPHDPAADAATGTTSTTTNANNLAARNFILRDLPAFHDEFDSLKFGN